MNTRQLVTHAINPNEREHRLIYASERALFVLQPVAPNPSFRPLSWLPLNLNFFFPYRTLCPFRIELYVSLSNWQS
jgi:hypothetical protein